MNLVRHAGTLAGFYHVFYGFHYASYEGIASRVCLLFLSSFCL